MTDTVPSDAPVGSPENYYGNAFYAKRTRFTTAGESMTDYNGATSRTWEMSNENKLHPYSKKPASYKLVSREVPNLLPKEGSLVWKRAGFARHAVHVTKCKSPPIFEHAHAHKKHPQPSDHIPLSRLRRPALARGPPRPADVGRAVARPARVDRRRHGVHREHGHRAVAHLRRHAHPRARGLPRHARRAHDAAAAPAQLLHQQPRHERAAELRHHPEPDRGQGGGRRRRHGWGEQDGVWRWCGGELLWRDEWCEWCALMGG